MGSVNSGIGPILASTDPSPDLASQALAHPLRHIGDYDSAKRLRSAILDAIAAGRSAADIGGSLGTKAFSEEVAARMRGSLAGSP